MRAPRRTTVRLGIWGVFGRGNFGNEATLAAFLNRVEGSAFTPELLCEDPSAATAWHGVPASQISAPASRAPDGRIRRALGVAGNRLQFLRGAFSSVRSLDAVVIAGSGGLERYGAGAFGTPFEMWCLAVASRLQRTPFLLLNVGVEHLPRRTARWFVRRTGALARYRSFRDGDSRASMVASGLARAEGDVVATDLTLALEIEPAPHRMDGRIVLGVMDYWGRDRDAERSAAAHHAYVDGCRQIIADLTAQSMEVRLVGGDDEDIEFARTLLDGNEAVTLAEARTPKELVTEMSSAHAVIATRYHTMIMSLLASTPVVSVGYGPKHPAMLAQLGLPFPHYDIEEFDPAQVVESAISSPRMAEEGEIQRAVDAARARLDAQWQDVEQILLRKRVRR